MPIGSPRQVTVPAIRARKAGPGAAADGGDGQPLVMVTAYDAPGARIADEAGVDLILVGDSLGMVVLGHHDTLQVTMDDMVRHTAAVSRAQPRALVVADLPWLSYHLGTEDTVRNGARLVRAGAQAVKLEGGAKRARAVAALADAEIPVVGHLGLTPQSIHAMGGYQVQATDPAAAEALLDDALALWRAGCFAIVVEGVPAAVARTVTEAVSVPTIGIGAGPWCDGQVLVFHDLLGLEDRRAPRFVRRYASLKADAVGAVSAFAADVRAGRFPSEEESYGGIDEMAPVLDLHRAGRDGLDPDAAPLSGPGSTPALLAEGGPLPRPAGC
ncbi:MAG: 3-methyl-2-oxobutanoate hydroxymethyltransferase [Actinomycetota bacterium]|nr:3-methyl-2-oxobutanoate hydroxymethyltransferase [Actinomycetota bacterium]